MNGPVHDSAARPQHTTTVNRFSDQPDRVGERRKEAQDGSRTLKQLPGSAVMADTYLSLHSRKSLLALLDFTDMKPQPDDFIPFLKFT